MGELEKKWKTVKYLGSPKTLDGDPKQLCEAVKVY